MKNKTVYLKDYHEPAFAVTSIALQFDLFDDHALVTNDMMLQRQHPGALLLNGDDLELVSIAMNTQPLDASEYRLLDGDLILDDCLAELSLRIVTRIRPQDNTQLSGLYRSRALFCTQCESEGFRRITFFPDRPDVLSVYTTRITADKVNYPVLLSNGNLVAKGDTDDGRHWVVWEDPFKKPSYLFALVAGQLVCVDDEFITASGRKVALRIFVEPGNEDKCAHAMISLKKSMRWDEEEYGREYDLDVFMIVAVSDFNMGAMENKGLNIFNEKCVLARADLATDDDYANIEGIVAHEYFHNWTGNRVTCRDWFQLSLKEGLTVFRDQEFSCDMNSRDVNRITDVKALLVTQFPEDAGSMAHPVRPDSYQEISNFYTATVYNKGAEVIRMQQALLGKEGFRRGMDLYFERHDGQAVTIDDFVAAMESANDRDLTQFKRWYSQAGTPTVEVHSEFKGETLKLKLTQTCPPTPECQKKQAFHIPIRVALFNSQGKKLAGYPELLELQNMEQTFIFNGLSEKPYVSLLRDFSAPIKLKRPFVEADLLALLRYETNGYAKWDAARQLVLTCLHGLLLTPREEWTVSPPLLDTLKHLLTDESLDPALRAELLAAPSFEEVVSDLALVDVDAVEAARDYYRFELGQALLEPARLIYDGLWSSETSTLDGPAFGRRKLRNVCLWLMMKACEQDALPTCLRQFAQAKTMTDQVASFSLLSDVDNLKIREDAYDAFYTQWAGEDLVLDKWLSVQASSHVPGTLARVKRLLNHPAFTHKNPNKVRGLIGAFVMHNPRQFHALDGRGYDFLVEQLIILDRINPSIAARLAMPFSRWQRFDLPRQHLMKKALASLAELDLSRDLREVVTKSLESC